MVYFIFISFLLFFSLFEFVGLRKIKIADTISFDFVCFVFCATYMFVLSAFRYKTGRDWNNYMSFFKECLYAGRKSTWEKGFIFLNCFFKQYVNNFFILQFCISVFCSVIIYRNFYRRSVYPIFTLFLYFVNYYFQTDMAQTRQYIALAIIICGYIFIEKRNIFLWCVIVLFAMQFHSSAIVAFPLYFTSKKQISLFAAIILASCAFCINIFGHTLTMIILLNLNKLAFLPNRLHSLLVAYLNINNQANGLQGKYSSGVTFGIKYFFIFIMIYFYSKNDKKNNFYFLNFILGMILMSFGRNFDIIKRCANYYFICGNGLCAYNLFIDTKKFFKSLDQARILLCILLMLFFNSTFIYDWYKKPPNGNSFNEDYLPYHSVFSM